MQIWSQQLAQTSSASNPRSEPGGFTATTPPYMVNPLTGFRTSPRQIPQSGHCSIELLTQSDHWTSLPRLPPPNFGTIQVNSGQSYQTQYLSQNATHFQVPSQSNDVPIKSTIYFHQGLKT